MRLRLTLFFAIVGILSANAQHNFWQDFNESSILLPEHSEPTFEAKKYRTLSLEFEDLQAVLDEAPMEFTAEAQSQPMLLQLPLPNGEMVRMEVVESPVMAPELAAKFPDIRSFIARGADDKLFFGRIDYSPYGLNAIISTPEGRVIINPLATEQTRFYASYYKKDVSYENVPAASCGFNDFDAAEEYDHQQQIALSENNELSFRNNEAVSLRKYRLALVCTGEYGVAKGGTVDAVMATFNTAANLINAIFQPEFAVRVELIAGNEGLVHTDPNSDPFVNVTDGGGLLQQNVNYLNSILPFSSYDMGHIFTVACSEGLGGIASLGSTCTADKARGVTCHFSNLTTVVTGVMAHELGHQFSASHSWNNCPPSLDQLSSANAFEPGSGSTIMSYQGSCGMANNIPSPGGDYYNIGSLEDFIFFAREGVGATCGETIETDNHEPTADLAYENGFWIPTSTPFELDVDAEDIDGDALTYCWEQYDLGPNTSPGNPIFNSPLFRSFPPTPNSKRVFPQLTKIIQNTGDNYEVLPTYERNMTFRVTVRDNNPEYGGTIWEEVAFKADGTAGPFRVTTPNTSGISWKVGEYREVNWNVANTDNNKVNCQNVNIRLSLDGGFTYPITLLENTPNDGSAFVTVPNELSNSARIRVEAANNIFFDISNSNFFIEAPTEAGYTFDVTPAAVPLFCISGDGSISVDVITGSILGYDSTLTLSLLGELPDGVTASFGTNTLTAGESTSLTLDLENQLGRDTLNLQVQATTPGQQSSVRELIIVVLSNDFSALDMLTPANGQEGIVFTTDFSWNTVFGANSYDIQIATSPGFTPGTILEEAFGLTDGNYIPEEILVVNTIYFWRIRPVNECGPSDYLDPFAFQTSTVDCTTDAPTDLPISLPNNPTTRTSSIFFPASGTITDLNLKDVQISYQPINSLKITLTSPAGTEVVLFDQDCLNTGTINLDFDDEAPTGIICPPVSGNPTQPANPLSAFDGEDTFGDWDLKIQVVSPGFGGGNINTWSVEFCSTTSPEAPSLIRNETLPVPPGESNTITTDYLEVSDNNSPASGIRYTLLTTPVNGQLFRSGDLEPLAPGESFTQQTIASFNLGYLHDGSNTDTDAFQFIVENESGGWLPNQTFNIEIDEGAVVNTTNLEADYSFTLFPNPAQNKVSLQLAAPATEALTLSLLSVEGKLLQLIDYPAGEQNFTISTAALPSGVYFVSMEGAASNITRKLVIQK